MRVALLRTRCLLLVLCAGAVGCGGKAFSTFLDREVRFSAASQVYNEGAGFATIPLELNAGATRTIIVPFSVTGNVSVTSSIPTSPGNIVFPAGIRRASIRITLLDDALDEPDEEVVISIDSPLIAAVGEPSRHILNILDDDPTPTLSVDDVTAGEAEGVVELTVSLSARSARVISVEYATRVGTATAALDFTGAAGMLTFTPGELDKKVQIALLDDVLNELDETFFLVLSQPMNAMIADGRGMATIINDDLILPVMTVADVQASEAALEASVTVRLSEASGRNVSIGYDTADREALFNDLDYAPATGTLVFSPGQLAKTITVVISNDGVVEGNETFVIDLQNPIGATLGISQAVITILDVDLTPSLRIEDGASFESDGFADLVVTLTPASGRQVTVQYATEDGSALAPSDYTQTGGTLTFFPGDVSKIVAVLVSNDVFPEPVESFGVRLSGESMASVGRRLASADILNNIFDSVFAHAGKIYARPDDNDDVLYRFDPGAGSPERVFYQVDSATGAPFTTFGNHLTRPAFDVENPSGTVVRYRLTPGTDLGPFAVGDSLFVEGCANVTNDRVVAATVTDVDDATDSVEIDDGVAPITGDIGCSVTLFNDAGPAGLDGADAMVGVAVGGTDYLIFGGHNLSGAYTELYFTSDIDRILDAAYCDLSSVTAGDPVSLQTVYAFGNTVYLGFASDFATQRPLFAHLDLSVMGAVCGALSYTIQMDAGNGSTADGLDYLGGGGVNANTATSIGIDSMIVFDDGVATALYVANNGGVASTLNLPPTSSSTWMTVRRDGDAVWTTGTTQALPTSGRVRPGEKGVPFMLEWGTFLFVARNRTDGAAELWKFNSTAWTRVVDTSDATNGMNANNTDISLLIINGEHLYVGFDNATDGAELWRTLVGITATAFMDHNDLEQARVSGIGDSDLDKNKYFFSGTSEFGGGNSYFYFTVGCDSDLSDGGACDRDTAVNGASDFSKRMFRQVD